MATLPLMQSSAAERPQTLSVDIGGTGIKMLVMNIVSVSFVPVSIFMTMAVTVIIVMLSVLSVES